MLWVVKKRNLQFLNSSNWDYWMAISWTDAMLPLCSWLKCHWCKWELSLKQRFFLFWVMRVMRMLLVAFLQELPFPWSLWLSFVLRGKALMVQTQPVPGPFCVLGLTCRLARLCWCCGQTPRRRTAWRTAQPERTSVTPDVYFPRHVDPFLQDF